MQAVCTCYMGFEYMGCSVACNFLETFQNEISKVDESKVMQVSSDGPNVNLAFLKKYASLWEEKELDLLMDLGTCGLHVVHGSMKAGAKASEWELQKLHKAMWQFMDDAPARRTMHKNISESTDHPTKFCGHCWCENKKWAEKAESLINRYQKFVTHVSTLRKNQQPDSKNMSFIVLKKMIHDPLISAKLKFFEMASHKLNAFLCGFQTYSPMVPFFADVLGGVVYDLLGKIILKDVLCKATNLYQLIQFKPSDKNTTKSAADIDIGFAANIKVEESNLNPNDPKVLVFKKEAGNFLAALLSHLLEKSPLKYALVRSVASLNPLNMTNKVKRSFCINHFSVLLQRFVKVNKISSQAAERAKTQYSSFFDVVDSNVSAFKGFSKENDCLDSFFANFIGTDKSYANMWEVCKIIFILSHGQSSAEHGFTINKQFSNKNLKEKSLIALCRVADHMSASEETPQEVQITRDMLH